MQAFLLQIADDLADAICDDVDLLAKARFRLPDTLRPMLPSSSVNGLSAPPSELLICETDVSTSARRMDAPEDSADGADDEYPDERQGDEGNHASLPLDVRGGETLVERSQLLAQVGDRTGGREQLCVGSVEVSRATANCREPLAELGLKLLVLLPDRA